MIGYKVDSSKMNYFTAALFYGNNSKMNYFIGLIGHCQHWQIKFHA